LTVDRTGTEQTITVTPESSAGKKGFEQGEIGVLPETHPHVRRVHAGEAAERAGLKPGDVIIAINGEPITFTQDLKAAITKRPAEEITLSILREGSPLTVLATPGRRDGGGFLGI